LNHINPNQIVTVTFFNFEGTRNKWWAFGEMGKRSLNVKNTEGPSFAKMFGTGGGNGFSIRPDFATYGWLSVWNTCLLDRQAEGVARDFFENNSNFKDFKARSSGYFTVFLRVAAAHGLWDGVKPFETTDTFDIHSPVAVLTRATIKPSQLHRFWRFVPTVSRSMEGKEGLIFSKGIGELPIVQQATFSLWTSAKAMMNYAYNSPEHAEVVRKTREYGWYSEELFARFKVFDVEGNMNMCDTIREHLLVKKV
jgi:hypothetical protein